MTIRSYLGHHPTIDPTAYIDPDACVIGRVTVGPDASIWPGAVVRGDVEQIIIGAGSNIQDGAVLHVTHDGPFTPGGRALIIGQGVTVGHRAVLHACTVGNHCLVGMGAVVMDDVVIGEECLVGAGALLAPGKQLPPRTLWRGNPATEARELGQSEIENLHYSARHYIAVKNDYMR
ncbi:MAG: gamma carbonic anhydrase family protein [Xanthomonadales bacterium]|nr:gamma carbonic anhydrase family protein [Xanthomonadales bacterium]